jgi:hypothetical protein
VAYLTCLGLAAVGGIPVVRRRRQELAQAASGLGATQLVIAASLAQQIWYGHIGTRELADISPLWAAAVIVGSLAAAVGVPTWLRAADGTEAPAEAVWGLRGFLVYAAVSSTVPIFVVHVSMHLVAALSFMGLWAILGWVALKLRAYRMFQLATAVLALRIIVIYFEVIGSLLNSGLGLIIGGVLTLLIAWAWRKKTVQVHGQFAEESRDEGESP